MYNNERILFFYTCEKAHIPDFNPTSSFSRDIDKCCRSSSIYVIIFCPSPQYNLIPFVIFDFKSPNRINCKRKTSI